MSRSIDRWSGFTFYPLCVDEFLAGGFSSPGRAPASARHQSLPHNRSLDESSPPNGPGDDAPRPSFLQALSATPVITVLLFGTLAGFLACECRRDVDHLLLLPGTEFLEPWRHITSLLPHFVPVQFVFPAFWIWRYGRHIEKVHGSVRTAILILSAAIVGGGLESALFHGPIGLAGVLTAVTVFVHVRARHDERYAEIGDRHDLVLVGAWVVLSIPMGVSGMLPASTGAHLGGAIVGFAYATKREWIPAYMIAINAGLITFAQPRLATWTEDEWVLRQLAARAYDAGDEALALERYTLARSAGDESLRTLERLNELLESAGFSAEADEIRDEVVNRFPGHDWAFDEETGSTR